MTTAEQRFGEQSESLLDGMVELVLASHNLIGIGVVLVILVQVGVVMIGLYAAPIRSPRQLLRLLLILFAAIAVCCMTVWLLLQVMDAAR